jgi:hypothetical protein
VIEQSLTLETDRSHRNLLNIASGEIEKLKNEILAKENAYTSLKREFDSFK